MERQTLKILFYLRVCKMKKNGQCPICMRITVDKKRVDILIQRSINEEHWNQNKECAKNKGREAEELNKYLSSLRARIYEIYRELQEADVFITAERIKERFLGKGKKHKTLLDVFNEHNEQCRKLVGTDFVSKTVQRYETTAKYLKEFMKKEYRVDDIALKEVTPDFINKFDLFLKTEKGCAPNAAITRLKNIKKMIRIALDNDWIKKNPFATIKFKHQETHPEFLTMAEIKKIASKEIDIARVAQVRDIYVFCCMSGLAFSDVQQLSMEHIIKDNNGKMWIRKTRQKTNVMCNIPLLPIPQKLIEKYSNHPECVRKGTLLPVPSNQRMNSYLKEVADICGIKKKLTTHTARHSYATSVCLANGVSMENVAKMLGHADTSVTKHYARVLDSSIMRDMEKVSSTIIDIAI